MPSSVDPYHEIEELGGNGGIDDREAMGEG
jgi:hypothetical protein